MKLLKRREKGEKEENERTPVKKKEVWMEKLLVNLKVKSTTYI